MKVALTGALSGVVWWAVSLMLGAAGYGIVGSVPAAGIVAGLATGLVMAGLSTPLYRRFSARHLLWYSPVSVYLAIAVYGGILFGFRLMMNDFHPDQIRWAVGVQSMIGMWWGVTFLLPVALVVHPLAYGNHWLLRRIARET
ncbi:MAG TPA: hypothetical protein VFP58_10330 [Candidatus Eisenbacteria bacterium]|nr:hypothetical protein [Candidatus Eisenbacteria bacterium]